MKPGLLPTPKDDRDIPLGAITSLPALSEIPDNFDVGVPIIKDQKDTDFCTAFMSTGMSELQEGVELSPEWAFAKSKEISGNPAEYGQDIRTALKVHTKHGAIAKSDSPYSLKNKSADFLRYIGNWPNLDKRAIPHVKASYVKVTGPYDAFDNIRATMWKYYAEKRGVSFGLYFGWPRKRVMLDVMPPEQNPHAMYFCGARKVNGTHYLRIVNSYPDAGENGIHLISREVVNHFYEIYGAYTFVDMPIEQLRYMVQNGITDKDNWVIQLMKAAVTALRELVALKKSSA